jgi:hypothetical protein
LSIPQNQELNGGEDKYVINATDLNYSISHNNQPLVAYLIFWFRNPSFFPNAKIQASRHLTPKSQIPFRIVPEIGSAVPPKSTSPNSALSKSTPNFPLENLFPQFLLIEQDLTLAFQLPSQVFKKDIPYGKIIKTPFSTQTLEMLPGFPVPIPGVVFLTAAPIFPAAFDSYFFENCLGESGGNLA